MTRRHELESQLSVLSEIKGILGAMKNLATLEIRKLSRMRASQNKVLETVQGAMREFSAAYGMSMAPPARGAALVLLVGSERGFCGNFNGMLIEQGMRRAREELGERARYIAAGSKLASHLEDDPVVVARLAGPNVAEEVLRALVDVLHAVSALRASDGALAGAPLWIAYHEPESGEVKLEEFTAMPAPPDTPQPQVPVRIQLPPAQLLGDLIEQHLFALVTRAVYASLIAENRFRLAHMETATRRIESRLEDITLRRNIQRQEDITQEMELILLSAGMLEGEPR